MKTIARKILGIVLIAIGLFALLTPFSPGSWLALIGLELLGFGVLLEKKILSVLKPSQRHKIENLMNKVRSFLRIKRHPTNETPSSDPKRDPPTENTNTPP